MDWPLRPVEQIPRRSFRPPHCPWPGCVHHQNPLGFRSKRSGSYLRACDSRRVDRFVCKSCGRSFSQQAFSCTYYLKRPNLLVPVAAGIVAGSAHRQIARSLGCAPSTVTRLLCRIGRHAVLLHSRSLQHLRHLAEPIAADHFETFVHCQLDALGIGTTVGHRSWFTYGLDPAPHRRGGKVTPAQKRQRARWGHSAPPSGQVSRSFARMLDVLLDLADPELPVTLLTDDHTGYAAALRRHPGRQGVDHRVYPNPRRGPKGTPRGPEALARDSALFPVDVLHALLRHTCAHHRRETIAFGRRINSVMLRAFATVAWRNLIKGRSERKPDPATPAMRLGLSDRPWSWTRLLAQRLFPARVRVPHAWSRVYTGDWDGDDEGRFVRHRLKHAA